MVCGRNSTVPHSSGDSIIRQHTGWRPDEKPVYLVLLVLFVKFGKYSPLNVCNINQQQSASGRISKPVLRKCTHTHITVVHCEHAEHTENVFREQIWFGDLRGPDPAGER